MKNRLSHIFPLTLAAFLAAAPFCSHTFAQEKKPAQKAPQPNAADEAAAENAAAKPVAVVAVASIEEVLGDVAWITEAAGQGDFGKMAALLSGGYTVGMDKKRPIGVIVTIEDDQPQALGFLPVKNLDAVLAGLEDQLGKPEDAGEGILELGGQGGNPIYVKEADGWAYVAQTANALSDLPEIDPAAVLGELTEDYTVAFRVNVANIPEEMKQVAVAQIKAQFERQFAEQLEEQTEEQREASERYMRAAMEQFTQIIEETDQATLGLQIDSQAQETHLDFSLKALPDTDLAEQMAMLDDVKSSHAGFLAEDAAVNMLVASVITEEDKALTLEMLKEARRNSLQEIENDEDIETEEARKIAKDVINSLFDVVHKTIEAGKIDGGAALFLTEDGKLNLVAGGTAKDAKQLEQTFRELIEAAKNEPNAPKVKFNAAQHAGVEFHTLTLPIPEKEAEARQIFGEEMNVALGFGQESVYVALGPAGLERAKEILDASQAQGGEEVLPAQFIVSLGPILKFASAVKEDAMTAMLAATLEESQGEDHIAIKAQPIERGVQYRIQVEKGVLELIGAAAKMMGAGQQQQQDQPPAKF